MSKRQLVGLFGCLLTVVILGGTVAFVKISAYNKAAEINAQTEIQKTEIAQKAKSERTKERMNWIPWYKGGEVETQK